MRKFTLHLHSIAIMLMIGLSTQLYAQKKAPSVAMFRGDAQHSGIYPSKKYNKFKEVKWKFKTQGKIFSTPVIVKGVAYVGSEDKHLYAVDISTGKQKWAFSTGGEVHSSPAVYDGVVYFTSYDGKFYAVDAETGSEKWHYTTEGELHIGGIGYWGMTPTDQFHADLWDPFISSPAIDPNVDGGVAYFGSGKKMYAVNLKTQKLQWSYATEGIVHTSPALANGMVYFGSWDTHVYALDAKSGKFKWSAATRDDQYNAMKGIQASPLIHNGTLYIGARDAYFYAFDALTGTKKWEKYLDGSWLVGSAVVYNNLVYVNTSDYKNTVGLDVNNGEIKFKFSTKIYVFSSPTIAGNTMYIGTYAGQMFAVDLESKGSKWAEFMTDGHKVNAAQWLLPNGSFDWNKFYAGKDGASYQTNIEGMNELYSLGSILSSPVIDKDMLYFGSADGNLYAVKLGVNKTSKVSIVSPDQNQGFVNSDTLIFEAKVEHGNGSIQNVEFFLDGLKISETDQEPFKYALQQPLSGLYTLTAVVTDNHGGKCQSDKVIIEVNEDTIKVSSESTDLSALLDKKNEQPESSVQALNVYPNPSHSIFNIDFTLLQAGNTTISIRSKNGTVAVVSDKFMEKGSYHFTFDASKLPVDMYVCYIVSNGSSILRKIVKQ